MKETLYATADTAERIGVTLRRVKYYCSLGLVSRIKRTNGGHRELAEEQMNKVEH